MGLVVSGFRLGKRRGHAAPPLRQRAVYRVVLAPSPRPWLGTLADLAEATNLSERDAREGILGLMKRETIHVVGTEAGGMRIFVLRALPR